MAWYHPYPQVGCAIPFNDALLHQLAQQLEDTNQKVDTLFRLHYEHVQQCPAAPDLRMDVVINDVQMIKGQQQESNANMRVVQAKLGAVTEAIRRMAIETEDNKKVAVESVTTEPPKEPNKSMVESDEPVLSVELKDEKMDDGIDVAVEKVNVSIVADEKKKSKRKSKHRKKRKSAQPDPVLSDFELPVEADYWYQPILIKKETSEIDEAVQMNDTKEQVKKRKGEKKVRKVIMKNRKASSLYLPTETNSTSLPIIIAQPVPKSNSSEPQPDSSCHKPKDEETKNEAIETKEVEGKSKKKKKRGKRKCKSKKQPSPGDSSDQMQIVNGNEENKETKRLDNNLSDDPNEHPLHDQQNDATIPELSNSSLPNDELGAPELATDTVPNFAEQQCTDSSDDEDTISIQSNAEEMNDSIDNGTRFYVDALPPSGAVDNDPASPQPVSEPVFAPNDEAYTRKLLTLQRYKQQLLTMMLQNPKPPSVDSMYHLYGIITEDIKVRLDDLYDAEAVLEMMNTTGQMVPPNWVPSSLHEENLLPKNPPVTATGLLQGDLYRPLLEAAMFAQRTLLNQLGLQRLKMDQLQNDPSRRNERMELCYQYLAQQRMLKKMMGEEQFKINFQLFKISISQPMPNLTQRELVCEMFTKALSTLGAVAVRMKAINLEQTVFDESNNSVQYVDKVIDRLNAFYQMPRLFEWAGQSGGQLCLMNVRKRSNSETNSNNNMSPSTLQNADVFTLQPSTSTETTATCEVANSEASEMATSTAYEVHLREMQQYIKPIENAIQVAVGEENIDLRYNLHSVYQVIKGREKVSLDKLLEIKDNLRKMEEEARLSVELRKEGSSRNQKSKEVAYCETV